MVIRRMSELTVITLLSAGFTAPYALANPPKIKAGDTIVVLHDTHLQVGSKKLAPVASGTELVAEQVRDHWVWTAVAFQDSKVAGWIPFKTLIQDPRRALVHLYAGPIYQKETHKDLLKRAKAKFTSADNDGNGTLALAEFVEGAKRETLDELNERLRVAMNSPSGNQYREVLRGRGTVSGELIVEHLKWVEIVLTFGGWRRRVALDDAYQLVDSFAKIADLHRSRLAQSLVDDDDPRVRSHRASVLFKWADRNSDGELTHDEF